METRELREKESLQFTEYTLSRPPSTRGSQQPCISDLEKARLHGVAVPSLPEHMNGIDEEERPVEGDIVDFQDPEDRSNPLNWPTWYKWMTVVLVSLMTFIK